MRVPSPTQGQTRITRQGMDYLRPANVDFSGLMSGLNTFAAGLASAEAEAKRQKDQAARFDATRRFVEFGTQSTLNLDQHIQNSPPGDTNLAERAINSQENYEATFINSLPEDLRDEFRMRAADTKRGVALAATEAQRKGLQTYQSNEIGKRQNMAKEDIANDDSTLEQWKADLDRMIDESEYTPQEKALLKQQNAAILERYGYQKVVKNKRMKDAAYTSDLVGAAQWAAQELGVPLVDLLTVISFETGGTFSTSIKGGRGGQHLGLIQFGPNEQAQFGVKANQSPREQMQSVVAFLKARGFKPGMGILDLYSTINAGAPGKYGASDTAAGGTPGTVADKVNFQMADHRAKALALLDGKFSPPDDIDSSPRFNNVPYEDRVTIRADVDTQVTKLFNEAEQQRKAQQAAFINDMNNRLLSGEYGRTEIEQAIDAGMIPNFEDRKRAFGIVEDREKDGKALRDGQLKRSQGLGFDFQESDDKKSLNAMFSAEGGIEKMNKRDEGYAAAVLVPSFAKDGALAPDALSILKAKSRSNNGLDVMFALQTLARLENANKDAYDAQVPEALKDKADSWTELHDIITDPNELLGMLRDAPTEGQRNTAEGLRKEAREKFAKGDGPILSDYAETIGGELPGHHLVRGEMEREWQALVTEMYVKTGIWDSAINLATKKLSRVWGATNATGSPVLMRNPPELVDRQFRPIAGSFDWADRQVRGELGIPDGMEWQLISDDKTEAQARTGKKPSYLIAINDENGWRFATDDQNRIIRHYFQPTAEDRKAQELDIRKGHLKDELDALLTYQSVPNIPVPEEIKKRTNEVIEQMRELDGRIKDQQGAQATQYNPLEREVLQLQEKFDALDYELTKRYADPQRFGDPNQWEQKKEYEEITDRLNAAKKRLEEMRAKRQNELEVK